MYVLSSSYTGEDSSGDTSKRTDGRSGGRTDKRTSNQKDSKADERTECRKDGRTDERTLPQLVCLDLCAQRVDGRTVARTADYAFAFLL